jgi:hypothetical protein
MQAYHIPTTQMQPQEGWNLWQCRLTPYSNIELMREHDSATGAVLLRAGNQA